ncbi:MAG: hypothetical protein OIF35_11125, partial [Cellvibrionaceae bacterium]|nr:hypothetical protein [Cellvibrionaceae bacterium]
KPHRNQNFIDRYGFANDENLDGKNIFLPRIGFKWDMNDEMTLSGGFGRYSGGKPNVWISNSFSNSGVTQVSTFIGGIQGLDFTSIPQQALDNIAAQAADADGPVNLIDPNYEIPSEWRTSLTLDWEMENGWLMTTGIQYNKKQDSLAWRDLSRTLPENVTGQLADGRFGYNDRRDQALMLTNGNKDGDSKIFSTAFSKQFDNGISLAMTYAYQDITEGNPGTSSTASSNYRFNIQEYRDQTLVGTSNFEIEHRFTASFNYAFELVEGWGSNLNLYWSRQSGRPYSQTLYQSNRSSGGPYYLDQGRRRSLL